jgi:putative transposase
MSDDADTQVTYFVTVRTHECRSVFHEPQLADVVVEVMETLRRRSGFKKYAYVVLPDHYHVLLGGGASSESVADLVLAINARVERFVQVADDGRPLWDDEPEVMVLYTHGARLEKLNYIHRKPVLCGVADLPEDYAWSSARFYLDAHGACVFGE